jgi:hypothetical protein
VADQVAGRLADVLTAVRRVGQLGERVLVVAGLDGR